MKIELANSKAIVTGAARGIGLEISKQLLAKNCHVIAVGRNKKSLERLKAEYPDKVSIYVVDLINQDEVKHLAATLKSDHLDLNILINNAAVQFEVDLLNDNLETLLQSTRTEITLNLESVLHLTVRLLPILKNNQNAAIVNISTGLIIAPKQASPIYCATKAAMHSFSQSLRYQCEVDAPNIQITEAIMALVDTDMTKGRGSDKITPSQAASEIIDGLIRSKDEVWVAKAKLLRVINYIAPFLARRILR